MSTVLPIGTTVCKDCRAPVAVVRRTVEVPCEAPSLHCKRCGEMRTTSHTHAIPDAAWTVVDADGERHRCEVAAA